MNFTDEQRAAIETHDKNLIVMAGAGSGKTRVLVERYLALLDANRDWSLNALVAITFTKKAAGEMRDRVRQLLETRYYRAQIDRDVVRWSTLLSEIDSARIDTIHGLCADLLRANAAEVGIDPQFDVMDDVDAAVMLEDAVDDTLAEIAQRGDETLRLIAEYGVSQVRNALCDPALSNANIPDVGGDLIEQWRNLWAIEAQERIANFLRVVSKIEKVDDPPKDDLIGQGWITCLNCIEKLNQNVSIEDAVSIVNDIKNIAMRGGSVQYWGDKETLSSAKNNLKAIRKFATQTKDEIGDPPDDVDEYAASLIPLWTRLIKLTQHRYSRQKSERGKLDFDDLESLACELLTNDSVQQRYKGTEFKHLLVDEFQDTNANQWRIVQGLAGLETPGSMFVVGDQKQSIYAFRGADVSVFGDVRQQILNENGNEVALTTSFRTHQLLIDCFNRLFGSLLVRDENSPVARFQVERGKPMFAERQSSPNALPSLDLILIDAYERDEQGEPLLVDGDKPNKLSTEERRIQEAYALALRLHGMVDSVRLIFDKESRETRPITYGDMAILFQSLSHVNLYEEVFKALNIPFVTVAGRGYYSRQEVWDLLNLLQAVYNPSDNLSLASALRSPLFGLSDDALFALRLQRSDDKQTPMSLWDALDQPGGLVPADEYEKVDFARDCLYDLHASAGRVTISELLRMALERTGYLATLTGLPDGMRLRGNIEKLLDKAESSGKVTLGAFSQYLRDLSARETREGDAPIDAAGAVNIMTVHASKGLEFPVVVLADASWERRGGRQSPVIVDADWGLACTVYDEEVDKQITPFIYRHIQRVEGLRDDAERLRLLYVGATRAQDLLIISGQIQQKDKSWQSSGWLDHLLNALDLHDTLSPCDDVTIDYDWGQARVSLPRLAPFSDNLTHFNEQLSGDWDLTNIDMQPLKPPLLYSVETRPEARLRHLSATHIADIGSVEWAEDYDEEAYYRDRFIREALQDAPTRVESVFDRSRQGASAQQIGEIVHEALRYWRLPGNFDADDLRDLLKSYAWKRGITEGRFVEDVASRAFTLLKLFEQSPVYHEIESARNTFRELPFVYQKDGYIVHGVIDLLFQKRDGHWAVMDYKTSFVQGVGGVAKQPVIVLHARRYHLQVGIYAQAASAQLHGETPETYVHYIRHNETVQISEEEWRDALSQKDLRNRIVQVIEGRM